MSPFPRDVKSPFHSALQIFLQQNFHCFLSCRCEWVYILISFEFHAFFLVFPWAAGCCQRLAGRRHWLLFPTYYHVWNEQLFSNVFINLWHLTIWLLQPIRRGSSSSGTLCCRSVQQFMTPGWFGSLPRAATCCMIISTLFCFDGV